MTPVIDPRVRAANRLVYAIAMLQLTRDEADDLVEAIIEATIARWDQRRAERFEEAERTP